MFSLYEQITQV